MGKASLEQAPIITILKLAAYWAGTVALTLWAIEQRNSLGVFGAPLISGIAIYLSYGATSRAVRLWWEQRGAARM